MAMNRSGQRSYAVVIVLAVVLRGLYATSVISTSIMMNYSTNVAVPATISVADVVSYTTKPSIPNTTPVVRPPNSSDVVVAVSMATSVALIPTSSPGSTSSFNISIELTEEKFDAQLLNKSSKRFQDLENYLTTAIKNLTNASVALIGFSPGSFIATFEVTTKKGVSSAVKKELQKEVEDGSLGKFSVLPTLISLPDAFEVLLQIKEKCVGDFSNKASSSYKNFASKVEKNIKENSTMAEDISGVQVKNIECPKNKNFTTVLILVQVNKTTSQIPDKELKDLKNDVQKGQVGELEVEPGSWKSYKPGQMTQFTVSLKLTSDKVSEQELKAAIGDLFSGNESEYIDSSVVINGNTATIKIGMVPRSSSNPSEALKPLKEAVEADKIGSIGVDSDSYKAWPTTNAKVFQVEFYYPMKGCKHATLHDNPELKEKVANHTIKKFVSNRNFKDVSSVELLECTPDAVQVRVVITMDPAVTDDPKEAVKNLVKCNKVNRGMSLKITLLVPINSKQVQNVPCPTTPPLPTTQASLPTTTTPQKLPKLYVKLTLDMTWREFCSKSLDQKLKEKIAENVRNKNGQPISPDQVVFFNKEKRCNDSMKQDEQAELWFYVSHAPGSKKLARCLTLQAFKKLKKFLDTDSTSKLGPEFDGKVVDVRLGGCDAYKYLNKKSPELSLLAIIIIAVLAGVVVLLLLLLLWCCCWFICCRSRRRRRKRKEQGLTALEVLPVVVTDGQDGLDGKNNKKKKDKKDKGKDKDKDKKKKKGKGSNDDGAGNEKDKTDQNGGGTGVVAYQNNAYDANPTDDGYAPLSDDAQGKHDYATLDNQKDGNANLSADGGTEASTAARSGPDGGTGSGGDTGTGNGSAGGSGDGTGGGSGSGPGGVGGLMAPVIVTSPASGSSSKPGSSPSTPANARRGSSSLGDSDGRGSGSKPSSPLAPRHADRGRRRSSAHSTDEEVDPLTHKTATVGIVALALRNKNEKKKDTEFKNLNQEMPEEGTYPASTENKNRSPYILPEPKTRVKLSTSPDYINANLMRDHKGQPFYIATQHPVQESIDDYWRMVWDQKSTVLVMVNDEEKDKPKDFPAYLPSGEGNTKKFGSVDVTVKTVTTTADYVITTLAVGGGKPGAAREVTHFHFTSWKGRGAVPNVGQFVAFVMAARKVAKKTEESKAPIIANCNTGQGFSGVYIALDIGIRSHQESKTSVVDVFEVAKKLRHDRKGIIATRDHYNFIYQALYEYTVNYDEDED